MHFKLQENSLSSTIRINQTPKAIDSSSKLPKLMNALAIPGISPIAKNTVAKLTRITHPLGNPNGPHGYSIGIALPAFIADKDNQALYLAIIFFGFIVVLLSVLFSVFSRMGKFDDNEVLTYLTPLLPDFNGGLKGFQGVHHGQKAQGSK
jgi:hypothetical protein